MTSISIDIHGDRVSVKVSPMQSMSSVVEQVLQQGGLSDSVSVSDARLIYNKRELDKSTPFRFLNIPAAARIELITGLPASRCPSPGHAPRRSFEKLAYSLPHDADDNTKASCAKRRAGFEPRLGLQSTGGPQVPPKQTAGSLSGPVSTSAPQQAQSTQQADAAASPAQAAGDAGQGPASSTGRLPPPSAAASAGQQTANAAPAAAEPDPLGLGRPVLVYSRRALEETEGGAGCAAVAHDAMLRSCS